MADRAAAGRPRDEPMTCACGSSMSRNPHPDAGKPTMDAVDVGYVWECIPCLVATRNRVGASWRESQREVARYREAFNAARAYIHGGQDRRAESQARYTAWVRARDRVLAESTQAPTIPPDESDALVPDPDASE